MSSSTTTPPTNIPKACPREGGGAGLAGASSALDLPFHADLHLVAWVSRVDAVIAGPLGLMRCGRSWGVPAPACGSGCRQQLPPLLLDACRFASAARDRLHVSSGRYRLPPRHASCTPTLSANPSGHVRQSPSDAGHAVWAPSRPSGSAPHSTAVAR